MAWRSAFVAFFAFVIACGAFGADEDPVTVPPRDGGTDEASSDGSALADAGVKADTGPAGPCDLTAPFGPQKQIVAGANENLTAALSDDELTIFFDNFLGTRWAIYTATRANIGDTFTTASEIGAPVALVSNDTYNPALSTDGLTLIFMTNRDGSGYHLWKATRTSTASGFGAPGNLSVVNSGSAAQDREPFLATDGALWFTSERPTAGGDTNVFRAPAVDGGGYSVPAPVNELNSTVAERKPVLSRDGLTVFFGSKRSGGKGGTDVWSAKRTKLSAMFEALAPVGELDTASDEFPTWISADSCRLYFVSDRSGTKRLYVASRGGK